MKKRHNIIDIAKRVINIESKAILDLEKYIDQDFENSIQAIYHSKGRIIVTGIGKSANIASKIVATFNSTGSPAIFMHAADAIHGDLGTIQADDVVLCISKSGNTPEIKVLIPLIKNYGNKIIAISGNKNSYLGEHADFFISSYVKEEACPNNLAPTSSTTAQLVVEDLMLKNDKPSVLVDTAIKDVILEISKKRVGTTAVIENDKLVGIITDGDLRRMLESGTGFEDLSAKDIMSHQPRTIVKDALAVEALQKMENNSIMQLLVVDNGNYLGVIHLHDLLKEGIF